jgi:hypothetical protein
MQSIDTTARDGVVRREWRELAELALTSLATGLVASLVLALAVFIISFEAQAAARHEPSRGSRARSDAPGGKAQAPALPALGRLRAGSRVKPSAMA